MCSIGTADQKEETMESAAQAAIIGIDVGQDWLDNHCLPVGQRQRLPNTEEGHAQLVELASSLKLLLRFEAIGDQQ